jgi:anthranilate synthase/aminodeoxychorismate synthase-like glutamine amidotransferase
VSTRLLLIDNYDSFTYNLVQGFMVLGAEVIVYRNDALTVEQALSVAPTHLCVSPGPGTPQQAGVSIAMIRAFAGRIPVFGVCLGHQSITEAYGKTSPIEHDGRGVFTLVPSPCEVGRYHSLIAARESLPAELVVTARTAEGEIMGLRHTELNIEGVQFHPESVLTPQGPLMMKNFLAMSGARAAAGSGSRS